MNNSPNKASSNKKSVLNFNVDTWRVDMPIKKPSTPPQVNLNPNSVNVINGQGNLGPQAFSVGSVPNVNPVFTPNSVGQVSTPEINKKKKKKGNGWKIFWIVFAAICAISFLVNAATELGLITVSFNNTLTEFVSQISDNTVHSIDLV